MVVFDLSKLKPLSLKVFQHTLIIKQHVRTLSIPRGRASQEGMSVLILRVA